MKGCAVCILYTIFFNAAIVSNLENCVQTMHDVCVHQLRQAASAAAGGKLRNTICDVRSRDEGWEPGWHLRAVKMCAVECQNDAKKGTSCTPCHPEYCVWLDRPPGCLHTMEYIRLEHGELHLHVLLLQMSGGYAGVGGDQSGSAPVLHTRRRGLLWRIALHPSRKGCRETSFAVIVCTCPQMMMHGSGRRSTWTSTSTSRPPLRAAPAPWPR